MNVPGWPGLVSNARVYGLEESIIASGYPMAVDVPEYEEAVPNENDYARARKLGKAKSGSGHDCFLKGIIVQFDLTVTQLIYPQIERYHFIDPVSSMSKMHRITRLNLDTRLHSYVLPEVRDALQRLIDEYNADPTPDKFLRVAVNIPMGLKLTARWTTNYLQLKTIYFQRRNHKLPEWREFCQWILTLPYFREFVLGEDPAA